MNENQKVAVLIYLYDMRFWDEISQLLFNIKDHIAIHISLYKHADYSQVLNDINNNFDIIDIEYVENHGVDISPFLNQIKNLCSEKFPFFIKIHSKSSNIMGLEWKYLLINDCIGSKEIFLSNLSDMNKKDNIGAITNKSLIYEILSDQHHEKLNELEKIVGVKETPTNIGYGFMAGDIFWGRTNIFKKYFNAETVPKIDCLLENGLVKDVVPTYCHACERLFGTIVSDSHHIIAGANIKPYMQIYNKKLNIYFDIYKCYNSYCHNNDIPRIFGRIFETNIHKSCVINWDHVDSEIIHFYQENSDNKYLVRK